MTQVEIYKQLMAINVERQFNCGDGGGKGSITHSFRCNCDELDRRAKELRLRAGIEEEKDE